MGHSFQRVRLGTQLCFRSATLCILPATGHRCLGYRCVLQPGKIKGEAAALNVLDCCRKGRRPRPARARPCKVASISNLELRKRLVRPSFS